MAPWSGLEDSLDSLRPLRTSSGKPCAAAETEQALRCAGPPDTTVSCHWDSTLTASLHDK
ncbi:hypothetical protein I79_011162 [Cricetulus griseus]|uniref:Uncharacterized protein n=1 Tax=Cricetulus griseus TaxID=10029 RepID=G3HKE2_CRIGR|nr:hypothetical protein I79_011162 [Cricetulus griseus]